MLVQAYMRSQPFLLEGAENVDDCAENAVGHPQSILLVLDARDRRVVGYQVPLHCIVLSGHTRNKLSQSQNVAEVSKPWLSLLLTLCLR